MHHDGPASMIIYAGGVAAVACGRWCGDHVHVRAGFLSAAGLLAQLVPDLARSAALALGYSCLVTGYDRHVVG
jgi:hypothetical protein